ncbi:MAG: hypothetical protein A2Z38_03905 [Planctomycetes bacterium RBG_19FT_COMBO_48_8]|nr:MAG: hypothetical protein A2Z38_03905 [Planctomycetes bacterium RBG_19FT_COMBO_48_8]
MKLHKCGGIGLFAALVAASVLVVGCLVCVTDEQYTGVENDTLKQVKCGQTMRDWVVETFGEPNEQILTDDGGEILKYKCVMKKDNKFVLFPPPIFISDERDVEHTVVFEVRDGIVQRYWKED